MLILLSVLNAVGFVVSKEYRLAQILPFIVAAVVLFVLLDTGASYSERPNSREECKRKYSDVSWINRLGIIALEIFTILFLTFSISFSFYTDYKNTYPKASEFLVESGISENAINIIQCFPRPMVEYIYVNAQYLSEASAFCEESKLSKEDTDLQLNKIADRMDEELHSTFKLMIVLLISVYINSLLRVTSMRVKDYHKYMRKFDEETELNNEK